MRASLALLLLVTAACESGVINDQDLTPDAPPVIPDATPPNHLGLACDPMAAVPCPDNWECLTQLGGSGSWCTKPCTGQTDPSCNIGYTGPGWGACILTPMGAPGRVCAIVCQDLAGPPEICPPGEDCIGSCPAPLQCQSSITDGAGAQVGSSCS
jgi:hypothetical protein